MRRAAILLLVVAVLGGCDVFLISRWGRWNPNDPDGEVDRRVLTPVVDGFVHGADHGTYYDNFGRYFDETYLTYDYYHDGTNSGNAITLVRFDLSAIPGEGPVVAARLRLYVDYVTEPEAPMEFWRIAQPWDTGSVDFEQADDTLFVVGDAVREALGPGEPFYQAFDITPIVQAWRSGRPNYGLRVRALTTDGGYSVETYSSEEATGGPTLLADYVVPD